jgi:hypothetical protein
MSATGTSWSVLEPLVQQDETALQQETGGELSEAQDKSSAWQDAIAQLQGTEASPIPGWIWVLGAGVVLYFGYRWLK